MRLTPTNPNPTKYGLDTLQQQTHAFSPANGFIITWILHQFIMYSKNKTLRLLKIRFLHQTPLHPSPPLLLDDRADEFHVSNLN